MRGCATRKGRAVALVRAMAGQVLAAAKAQGDRALEARVKAMVALAVRELAADRARAARMAARGMKPANGPTPACNSTW